MMEFKILKKYMVEEMDPNDENGDEIEWDQIYEMEKFKGGFLLHLWGGGPSGGLFLKDNKFYHWEQNWGTPKMIGNKPRDIKVQIYREHDYLLIRYQ
jgi:hypothetical protein